MSINILKQNISNDFNLTVDNSNLLVGLKDLKINGKYIDKIYWCDSTLFSTLQDNCGLIYKRNNDCYQVSLSGHIYDILTNIKLNDVNISFQKINTRNPKIWETKSFAKGKEEGEAIIDDGYYSVSGILSNSIYEIIANLK